MFKKLFTALKLYAKAIIYSTQFLWLGVKNKTLKNNLNYLIKTKADAVYTYVNAIKGSIDEVKGVPKASYGNLNPKILQKLRGITGGLHSLLPNNDNHHYSMIMLIDNPVLNHFQNALEAAKQQTAPNMEIILAIHGEQSPALMGYVQEQSEKNEKLIKCVFGKGHSKAALLNMALANAAGNNFVFIDQDGWMRPDVLFRFQQVWILLPEDGMTFLYCDEWSLTKLGALETGSQFLMPDQFYFPYEFSTYIPGCLCISKVLIDKAKGFDEGKEDAHFYDLLLRLNLAGGQAKKVDVPLYARRHDVYAHLAKNNQAAITALKEYVQAKGLDWAIELGYMPGLLRAIPSLSKQYSIHVIIPYKDQKTMTLAAARSLQKQEGVILKITAVDNRSSDLSIAQELEAMGVEVLSIDEPFNFSRLNNLAVQQTKIGKDCDLVFCMNNDVELMEDALVEMCRWIDQPNVGMVGCRLNYPDGRLQCGGVDLNRNHPSKFIVWDLTDNKCDFEKLLLQKTLRIARCISGAAALLKREVYIEVGGFDEIWYPITYSDTNLSFKLEMLGYLTFYTPYAVGTHHESASRIIDSMENFEASTWLQDNYYLNRPFKPLPV